MTDLELEMPCKQARQNIRKPPLGFVASVSSAKTVELYELSTGAAPGHTRAATLVGPNFSIFLTGAATVAGTGLGVEAFHGVGSNSTKNCDIQYNSQ